MYFLFLFLKQSQKLAKFDIEKYCTFCTKISYLTIHKKKYAIKNKSNQVYHEEAALGFK